jgi:PAS domain S-box-containing protein
VLVLNNLTDAVGLGAYLFTSGLIIALGHAARSATRRANERRELLRVTLLSIGDAVITTDVEGRVTYLNSVAEALTGWTPDEAIDQPLDSVFRIVNEDSRQPVESPASRALREGVVVGLANHTVLLKKDGGECPIDDSAAPIRDEAGLVSGCVLIFRDVTQQRRIERERAHQLHLARLLATIIETTDDAIVSKSLDGTIQSWNAAAERLFGHTAQQAVGQHISLIIPPERLSEEDEIIARLSAGERIEHFETERLGRDGQRLLVSLTISPLRDESGAVVGASKIARDVTHRRYAEHRERQLLAETAAANAKFQAFFEQGALFAAILDVDGSVLEPNRLFAEGCGYTRNAIIGKPVWDGPWWADSADARARIQAATTEAAGGHNARVEVSYRTADGSQRNGVVVIQPIKRYADQVLFLALSGADITERKRLEDDLRELAADLSEADRKKNEFLAMLAHELRNPLAPISNTARALRLGIGDEDAVRSASEMLERQVSQLARLVDDLLDISRITRGRIELRTTRTALAPIVLQAVEAVRPLARSMNHELTTTLPENEIYVEADPARLTQVVGNILNNACKFTNPGGHVQLVVNQNHNEATIRVRDNGIGIAPEHLSHVFDMFAQVDASLERSRDGLGIGLTLVRTLVELHGGSIQVNSEGPGRGSEFTVRLPVVEPAPTAVADDGIAPARAAAPHRVLIVDDNDDGAESLSMLLQFDGHDTLKAHSGPQAIEAADRFRPDVMLLDIGLPGMSGYEVCQRIRQEPWGQRILIVAMTGWGQEEDRRRSMEAGFDTHMVKPVDHEALLKLLASIPGNDDAVPQMT